MKVEGPNKTSGAKGVSKTGKKGATGDTAFSSMVSESEETADSAAVSRTSAVGALDALLALQEAGTGSDPGGKKARKRADDLLDQLDRIKMGLLTGELPKSTVQQLAQMISSRRDQIMDPKLLEILDEIDLRAQVELAKFEQS
jgi:hypothetical protein